MTTPDNDLLHAIQTCGCIRPHGPLDSWPLEHIRAVQRWRERPVIPTTPREPQPTVHAAPAPRSDNEFNEYVAKHDFGSLHVRTWNRAIHAARYAILAKVCNDTCGCCAVERQAADRVRALLLPAPPG